MAKITITQISIENLGPFRERQTLALDVKSGSPVVLIKALNGSGKTTLLTAMQIGLYGYKAINAARRSEYEQLISSLQRQDATGNSIVEVTVMIEIAGTKQSVITRREWQRQAAFSETFSVINNGIIDTDFTERWDEFINGILPVELVQLFLFDGEKIEALANPDRLPDLLRRATEVFLGLGGIDALENDLKAVERRTITKNKEKSGEFGKANAEAEHFKNQQQEIEQRIEILSQKRATTMNELTQAQKTLDMFTVRARRDGLDAFRQASELKTGVDSLAANYKEAQTALREAISDPLLPLAWLGPLWQAYQTQWEEDIHANNALLLAEEFKKRDTRILKSLAEIYPKENLAFTKIFKQDLAHFKAQNRQTPVLLPSTPPSEIQPRLEETIEQVKQRLSKVAKTESALSKAEKSVDTIPAEEQLSGIFGELQTYSNAVSTLELKASGLTHELTEAETSKVHIDNRLNSSLERIRSEFKDQALEIKGLEAAARAKETLRIFKERLLASKALWLSEMITSEFKNLLRKRNFISRVVVDPNNYAVTIEDTKGHAMPMERLSAGERQILAIAVLSALIRERKGRFPVVVDTPLARLDRNHRESLIRNFFAKISHQVMVLSTDEEVEGSVYDALQPYISSEYALIYDDHTHYSTVHTIAPEVELGVAS